ncbi:retrovirus-related pol polyprotein from transposon TNT 1-94 [Tanacetum coccineum]
MTAPECHKCGKKGHFARDCWSKTSVPSYQSPFQPKLLHSSEHKPEPRHTKDFEAKYNKVKAKLALFSSSSLAPTLSSVKALMALADEERVSVSKESARNGIKISMKNVQTLLEMEDNDDRKSFLDYLEQIPTQKKKILGINQLTKDTSSSGPNDLVFVKSSADNSEVSITGSNKSKLSEAEDSTLSNHNTGKHPLPPLEKLTGAKPVSGPKTIKSILKSKSTFKAETLKGIIINEPSSAPARGNKGFSASKTNSAPAGESSSRSRPARPAIPFPSCIHYGYNDHKSDDCVYYPICEICGSYDHDTHGHNRIISLRRGIKLRNPQHVTKNCETLVRHCSYNLITMHLMVREKEKAFFQAKKVDFSK